MVLRVQSKIKKKLASASFVKEEDVVQVPFLLCEFDRACTPWPTAAPLKDIHSEQKAPVIGGPIYRRLPTYGHPYIYRGTSILGM